LTLAAQNTWTVEDTDGAKTAFDINFKVYDTTALEVVVVDPSDGTETVQTPGSDYSVSGSPGSYQAVFVTAPADALKVSIRPVLDASQSEGFDDFSRFPASKAEGALDRLTHLVKATQDWQLRGIRVPADEAGLVVPSITERKGGGNGSLWYWDGVTGKATTVSYDELVEAAGALVGAEALAQIAAEGDSELSQIAAEGDSELAQIATAGDNELAQIATAGDNEQADIASAGTTQIAAVGAAGDAELVDIGAAGDAEIAAVEAEGDTQVANVASAAGAQFYADTTAGLAAVSEGEYFIVMEADGDGNDVFSVYRDLSGVATLQNSIPSVEVYAAVKVIADLNTEYRAEIDGREGRQEGVYSDPTTGALFLGRLLHWAIKDGSDYVGAALMDDGTFFVRALQAAGAIKGEGLTLTELLDDNFYSSSVTDPSGNTQFGVRKSNGAVYLYDGSIIDPTETNYDFEIRDENDNVAFGVQGSTLQLPGGSIDGLSARDAKNLADSEARQSGFVEFVQRPTAADNSMIAYGQSLAAGAETWPSLSQTNVPGTYMYGDHVNGAATEPEFAEIGTAALNPLVASTLDNTTILDSAGEAALTPGDGAIGEPPIIGWVNGARRRSLQSMAVASDDRDWIALNAARGGRTIEQLSKVNTQDSEDWYARLFDGLGEVDALTTGTHVCSGLLWMQGEHNYTDKGGSWDKATYKSLLGDMFDNLTTDIAAALTDQEHPPCFLTYQTGASYTRDVDSAGDQGLHVGMAQLELANERSDLWMVGPVYPYTDKGGHLDSNGSRWFGHQVSKVWHRIVMQGLNWSPLRPVRVTKTGNVILIDFHVPVAPLVFDSPYVETTATDYDAKGFKVTTASGATVGITVSLAGATIVQIDCATDPGEDGLVWYADKTVHEGNGCLRDSDPTKASDLYEYVPARGMYAGANIAALVDERYPLQNWSVAFCVPMDYED